MEPHEVVLTSNCGTWYAEYTQDQVATSNGAKFSFDIDEQTLDSSQGGDCVGGNTLQHTWNLMTSGAKYDWGSSGRMNFYNSGNGHIMRLYPDLDYTAPQ